ncbi:MAG TPA: DMT family transporter [Burkholderiaceae bacterium]|jgi:drug/metabolite transporter (DMT)-like permease|nr:DMT family transporter [Burkholderiaceae bacterium]
MATLNLPAPRPWLGIGLIVAAVCCFASMDTTVRYVGQRGVPVLLILWMRYALQTLLSALWIVSFRTGGFRTTQPRFQALRGTLLLLSSAFTFVALQHLPVPELTSINMLGPVLVTALAGWLLREPVSGVRKLLVAGGLVGALVVIRPGGALFGWIVLLPICATLSYAAFQLLTSRMTAHDNAYTTNFYSGLVGTLLATPVVLALAPALPQQLMKLQTPDVALLVAIGTLGTTGHLLLIRALGIAPASTLMPFLYVQIGAATLIAWIVFGHLPDPWAWLGMAIIAACGAATAWLNVRSAQRAHRIIPAASADTVAD